MKSKISHSIKYNEKKVRYWITNPKKNNGVD